MAQSGNSSGSVFLAFVIGAAAGAAVALLYAPAPGEETRRKLAEKAREGRERADDFAREGRSFVERQRENIVSAVERGREAFDEARKESL
jgi:gas vesicle protein